MHIKNSIKLINNDVKKNPITATSIADGIDAVAKVITKPNMLEIIAPTVLGTNKQLSSKQSQSFEQNILNIIAKVLVKIASGPCPAKTMANPIE